MKVVLHPTVDEFRGGMNRMVFKKVRGKIIASAKPTPSEDDLSPAQLAHQERFKEAAIYARIALGDPNTAEAYELAAKLADKPAFALCVRDFLKPPTIKALDTSAYHGQVGDAIKITTQDDFGVVNVHVKIGDGSSTLESGDAVEVLPGSGLWKYTATTQIASGILDVEVTATDRPGGTGLQSINVDLS